MPRGFSLLELMVTLVVVAVLAAVALPSFFGDVRKTKASSEVAPVFSDLRVRLEQYLQENGAYPPTVGESTWNPSVAPGPKTALDLAAPGWQPLQVRLSGDALVYCRYTFVTGTSDASTNGNVGPQGTAFGFTPPAVDWYYLLATCDMDGDPSAVSWYFATAGTKIMSQGDGK